MIEGEFLTELKKEFGGEDNKLAKVTELKRVEWDWRTMEKFIQEFRRVARGSKYDGRALVEEFKHGMNEVIRRNLIEAERPSWSIVQWYECATNLDWH